MIIIDSIGVTVAVGDGVGVVPEAGFDEAAAADVVVPAPGVGEPITRGPVTTMIGWVGVPVAVGVGVVLEAGLDEAAGAGADAVVPAPAVGNCVGVVLEAGFDAAAAAEAEVTLVGLKTTASGCSDEGGGLDEAAAAGADAVVPAPAVADPTVFAMVSPARTDPDPTGWPGSMARAVVVFTTGESCC
jgi:hypothetical protein